MFKSNAVFCFAFTATYSIAIGRWPDLLQVDNLHDRRKAAIDPCRFNYPRNSVVRNHLHFLIKREIKKEKSGEFIVSRAAYGISSTIIACEIRCHSERPLAFIIICYYLSVLNHLL